MRSGISHSVTPFSTFNYVLPVRASMIKDHFANHVPTGFLKRFVVRENKSILRIVINNLKTA